MELESAVTHVPWNKGRLTGQKAPLRLPDIWAIRVRLQLGGKTRELALFDLAIDSKLRGCDLVSLHVGDIAHGDRISSRASVMQHKTKRPVQFEITESTRAAVSNWIKKAGLHPHSFLFPSRLRGLRRTCQRGSTPELCIAGSPKSDSTRTPTERTACAERRRH